MTYRNRAGRSQAKKTPPFPADAIQRWLVEQSSARSQIPRLACPPNRQTEQATVGVAVAIIGACLMDDAIGPLPQLTAALGEVFQQSGNVPETKP